MKQLTLNSVMMVLMALYSLHTWAYDVEIDGIYYNLDDWQNTAEVVSGDNEYWGDITIPSSIEIDGVTYTVASIGYEAFRACIDLTSVIIPNSVTSIGGHAFEWCSGLTSVTIPNSVTSIGDHVFYNCSGLTTPIYNSNCFVRMPSSYEGEYTIPDGINIICGGAFRDCRGLTSVTIPNSVTSIGISAFYGCRNLTSVTIPNSVTSIDIYAFEYCSSLTTPLYNSNYFVRMPSSYEGEYTIPDGINIICGSAFSECSGLTSVIIPNSVTSIGDWAFYDCEGLTSITIPNSVTSIGYCAFNYCSSLTSIPIPNSVTNIEVGAFFGCSGLTSVTIPNSVTSISDYTFWKCSDLISVTIPNSVTSIGDYAFSDCSGLTSVVLDMEEPFDIGTDVFSGIAPTCTLIVPPGTKDAYIAAGWTTDVFKGGIVEIGEDKLNISPQGIRIGLPAMLPVEMVNREIITAFEFELHLPDGITLEDCELTSRQNSDHKCSFTKQADGKYKVSAYSDASKSFSGNVGALVNLMLEVSEDLEIGDYLIGIKNIKLTQIDSSPVFLADISATLTAKIFKPALGEEFTENNLKYKVTSESPKTVELVGYEEKPSGALEIPAMVNGYSVTNIGEKAFTWSTGLTSVTISEGVKSIDEYAFYYCTGLKSIIIPEGVTNISSVAFTGCQSLTSLTIPSSMTYIGSQAFAGCTNIEKIYCKANPSKLTWEDGACDDFMEGDKVTKCYVLDKAAFEAKWSTGNEDQDVNVTFVEFMVGDEFTLDNLKYMITGESPMTVELVGYETELSGVVEIPATVNNGLIECFVTSIGQSAFYDCSGLTSVTISNGVTSIGDLAFYGCEGLTSVTIPNSVTSIGWCAFMLCSDLISVTIPNSVTSIGDWAFSRCSGLTSVTIPNSVTSIGNGAFSYCSSLTTPIYNSDCFVVMPSSYEGEYTIPDGINIICDGAFMGCSGLTSVTIPNSVTSIGYGTFQGCSSLTSVTIPNSVTSIDDFVFDECCNLASIKIPNSVTSIGDYAFSGCSGLTSLTIPNSVTSIGGFVCQGCSGLTTPLYNSECFVMMPSSYEGEYTIPEGINEICSGAFYGCSGLTSVTIPNSVMYIGWGAFYGCSELTDVYSFAAYVSSDDDIFEDSYIENATLHVPFQSLEDYKSTTSWSGFGTFVAMMQMELELKEGWNWVSHNVANSLKPTEIFGENVVEVKSQTKGLVRDTKYGMVGNLTEMVAIEAYKVKTTEADMEPYVWEGDLFDAATYAINLKQGWNWIGYPMANEKSLEGALRNFLPMKDDCIVSQEFFTTYTGSEWVGTLDVFTPGKGYMYKSGEEKPLYFSKASSGVELIEAKARMDSEESQWTCDIHKYPNRMPAIVCLYQGDMEANVSDYDVAAFCGDECRGVGKVVKGVVMMNVCGEGGENITFKAIDKKSGIVMDIKETVTFTGDVLGAYTEPFRLTFNGESITGIATIKSETDVDAIYNMAGQRISTDKQTLPKGVYIYKGKKVMIK